MGEPDGDPALLANTNREHGTPDLCSLPELTHESITANLKARFDAELVYTYAGNVVVSVNPFCAVNAVGKRIREGYTVEPARPQSDLPPHVYYLVREAYDAGRRERKNKKHYSQSIIITGESGAGKTEAMKICLRLFGELATAKTAKDVADGDVDVAEKLMRTNPIMEPIGNAKTVRNDNSSRFGKLFEIQFNASGVILGASTTAYLLEKPRVCAHAHGERNYHVFYMLLKASPEFRQPLHLVSEGDANQEEWETHRICKRAQGGTAERVIWMDKRMNQGDEAAFNHMQDALDSLGVESSLGPKSKEFWTLIAIVIHIGDMAIGEDAGGNATLDTNDPQFKVCTEMMQVKAEKLKKTVLEKRRNFSKEEVVWSPRSKRAAEGARDSLCRHIYWLAFDDLVQEINRCLSSDARSAYNIGVLDIFGFENFNENLFSQLCINLTNESLHNLFIEHVFKDEQQVYMANDIQWNFVEYQDNSHTIDLIYKCHPKNLFTLLNDNSKVGDDSQGDEQSDKKMVAAFHDSLDKLKYGQGDKNERGEPKNGPPHPGESYEKPKRFDDQFAILHYAGKVTYTIIGFGAANRDELSEELRELLTEHTLNKKLRDVAKRDEERKKNPASGSASKGKSVGGKGSKGKTVSAEFGQSLSELMAKLSSTEHHYVRCLKPNQQLKPGEWDREFMKQQLQYSGMMELVEVRKAGLNVRKELKQFYYYYKICVSKQLRERHKGDERNKTKLLFEQINEKLSEEDKWVGARLRFDPKTVGREKVFLKEEGDLRILNKLREENMKDFVTNLQSRRRMVPVRRKYLHARRLILRAQDYLKARFYRSNYLKVRDAGRFILHWYLRYRLGCLLQQACDEEYELPWASRHDYRGRLRHDDEKQVEKNMKQRRLFFSGKRGWIEGERAGLSAKLADWGVKLEGASPASEAERNLKLHLKLLCYLYSRSQRSEAGAVSQSSEAGAVSESLEPGELSEASHSGRESALQESVDRQAELTPEGSAAKPASRTIVDFIRPTEQTLLNEVATCWRVWTSRPQKQETSTVEEEQVEDLPEWSGWLRVTDDPAAVPQLFPAGGKGDNICFVALKNAVVSFYDDIGLEPLRSIPIEMASVKLVVQEARRFLQITVDRAEPFVQNHVASRKEHIKKGRSQQFIASVAEAATSMRDLLRRGRSGGRAGSTLSRSRSIIAPAGPQPVVYELQEVPLDKVYPSEPKIDPPRLQKRELSAVDELPSSSSGATLLANESPVTPVADEQPGSERAARSNQFSSLDTWKQKLELSTKVWRKLTSRRLEEASQVKGPTFAGRLRLKVAQYELQQGPRAARRVPISDEAADARRRVVAASHAAAEHRWVLKKPVNEPAEPPFFLLTDSGMLHAYESSMQQLKTPMYEFDLQLFALTRDLKDADVPSGDSPDDAQADHDHSNGRSTKVTGGQSGGDRLSVDLDSSPFTGLTNAGSQQQQLSWFSLACGNTVLYLGVERHVASQWYEKLEQHTRHLHAQRPIFPSGWITVHTFDVDMPPISINLNKNASLDLTFEHVRKSVCKELEKMQVLRKGGVEKDKDAPPPAWQLFEAWSFGGLPGNTKERRLPDKEVVGTLLARWEAAHRRRHGMVAQPAEYDFRIVLRCTSAHLLGTAVDGELHLMYAQAVHDAKDKAGILAAGGSGMRQPVLQLCALDLYAQIKLEEARRKGLEGGTPPKAWKRAQQKVRVVSRLRSPGLGSKDSLPHDHDRRTSLDGHGPIVSRPHVSVHPLCKLAKQLLEERPDLRPKIILGEKEEQHSRIPLEPEGLTIEHLQACLPQHLWGSKKDFCAAFHKLTDGPLADPQRRVGGSTSVVEHTCNKERRDKPQQQLTLDGAMRAIVRAMGCTQTGFAVTFHAKIWSQPSSDTSASLHVEVAINQTGMHVRKRNSARTWFSFWISPRHAAQAQRLEHDDRGSSDSWGLGEPREFLFEWHTLKNRVRDAEESSGMLVLRALRLQEGSKSTVRRIYLLSREADLISRWLTEHAKHGAEPPRLTGAGGQDGDGLDTQVMEGPTTQEPPKSLPRMASKSFAYRNSVKEVGADL